jgi:hypothetical protein
MTVIRRDIDCSRISQPYPRRSSGPCNRRDDAIRACRVADHHQSRADRRLSLAALLDETTPTSSAPPRAVRRPRSALAPERDLGLVDRESQRLNARGLPDGAVDILDRPAAATHQVVVVVSDTRFVRCCPRTTMPASRRRSTPRVWVPRWSAPEEFPTARYERSASSSAQRRVTSHIHREPMCSPRPTCDGRPPLHTQRSELVWANSQS